LAKTGADILVSTLGELGVEAVFGIPGSHDAHLYNALRKSSIRTVLTTNELFAAFMANGYYRNSGKIGTMMAIAGPGFTNAITGLAEAFFDSVGMVCLICKPTELPGKTFQLQKINEKEIVRTVTKGNFSVEAGSQIESTLRACYELASTGEPGPVLMEISARELSRKADLTQSKEPHNKHQRPPVDEQSLNDVVNLIASSPRLIFYLGQGALSASHRISEFADYLEAPVLTTTSGRGIIPESHSLSLPSDLIEDVAGVNSMMESCDLIIVLGCKFTHNGAKGFRLNFPQDKMIHVDASSQVLGANYPPRIAIQADISDFLDALWLTRDRFESRKSGWKSGEIDKWRQALIKDKHKKSFPEPQFEGMAPPTAAAFFSSLGDLLPKNTCLITDSGLHQMMARKYFEVSAPRGLVVPADFQSMGFGIPAGIGAGLADPDRPVVVITGDGGFALCGMELSTAVREKINMTVFLFNDNSMGLIRVHQLRKTGHDHAVKTGTIDYNQFSASLGIQYFRLDHNIPYVLEKSMSYRGVSLIEVGLSDTRDFQKASAKGVLRNILKI